MKKLKFLVVVVLLIMLGRAEGQSWVWGRQGTTNSDPQVRCIAADSKGNVYTSGYFEDSISFGTYHLTSPLADVFLVKYDSNGNIIWVRQSNTLGGSGYYQCAVVTDSGDNVYISGGFTGTIHFGSITLTSSSSALFLVKYNSNGAPVWGVQTRNTTGGYEFANSITTDDSANVFITGSYEDSISFGPIKFHSNYGTEELFIVKYDSSGNVRWAKVSDALDNNSEAQANAVSCDLSGNVYVTGVFWDTLSIGTSTLKSLSYTDMFLLKYTGNGNLLWANQSNAQPPNGSINAQSVITDGYGNAYVTGKFQDTVVIGGFKLIGDGIFLTKYDFNGNAIWINTSPLGGWCGYSLTCDKSDHLYFSGGANGSTYPTVNFCNENLSTNAATDPSVFLKLDTAGNALSGLITRTGGDDENYVACSPNGKYVYSGGDIWDTITFGNNLLNNLGTEAPFVARLELPGNPESIFEIKNRLNVVSLFPNPNTGAFNLGISGKEYGISKMQVEVYNVMGECVFKEILRFTQDDNLIDIANQPNGIYLYRVIDASGGSVGEGKFVVEK